jgi:diaminopimelate decarboxylase
VIRAAFQHLNVRLAIELGRWLVGPAGVLLASVVLVKQVPGARFVYWTRG